MARRGTYAKGLAKREEILAAALDTIAERGYRKASVRDIAEAAGISPAGLLHYFGSKEELFIAILAARDARDAGSLSDDGVFSTFLGIVTHNATVPGLVQLYVQLVADASDPAHPARAFFERRTAELEGLAVQAIAEAQSVGDIRADLDPAWIARSAHALADGLQAAWLLNRDIDMAADIEQFISLLAPAPPTG